MEKPLFQMEANIMLPVRYKALEIILHPPIL